MVRFKMKNLLKIWVPILACIILSACGSQFDKNDKNSSQTVETTTMAETSSTSISTTTKVTTATTTTSTTTTTEAKINPDTYIGYWSPKDTEERELTIHNVNEKEVMFSLWYLRTGYIDNVYAEFKDGAAYFNQSDFKGNLVFKNNSITVNIEESSAPYIEPSNYVYNKKRDKSLQYGTNGGEIVCSDYHEIQGFYGSINSNGEKVKGLSTDYICYGKKYSEICSDVKNGRNVRTWSYARSYNEIWFECYDSDTDEYLGWIKDKYIKDNIKADITTLDSVTKGEITCSGTIKGYDSSYIVDGGKIKTVRTDLKNGWHVTLNRYAVSQGSYWYECYDTDDGDYYGWINADNIKIYTNESAIPEPTTKPDIPKLSQEKLREIARQLDVPDNVQFEAYQDDISYWEGAGIWIRYVSFMNNSSFIAGASVDAYTGEPQRAITKYEEVGAPFDEETPNVWCPYCGYGFFTTGVGSNGIDCPSCGENYMPVPGSPPDEP